MKRVLLLILALGIMVCATGCSDKEGKGKKMTESEQLEAFTRGLESLELPGNSSYNTIGELVTGFENLSDDHNTCMVNYDSISSEDLTELEEFSDFIYDKDKYYRHVKFTFISDYMEKVGEYNFVASMDEDGKVTLEVVTYSDGLVASTYSTGDALIMNGLDAFATKTKAWITLANDYDE